MYEGENGLGAMQYAGNSAKEIRMPSLQQRLDLAVQQAQERLAKVTEAREILARNPDLEKLLNIMQQSHF